jgi:hypothetical protein
MSASDGLHTMNSFHASPGIWIGFNRIFGIFTNYGSLTKNATKSPMNLR